jgi:hypothetical protein
MKISKLILAGAVAFPLGSFAAGQNDGIAFERRGPYVLGVIEIAPAEGGEYVFSSKPQGDGRRHMRFMLGKPQRLEYDLFSGEEEAALAKARDEQFAADREAYTRAHRPRVHRAVAPKLNWPKVVVAGDRTCVPSAGHANDADWKDHLVCWNAGSQHVE